MPTLWEGLVHWRLIVWTERILHTFLFGVNKEKDQLRVTMAGAPTNIGEVPFFAGSEYEPTNECYLFVR